MKVRRMTVKASRKRFRVHPSEHMVVTIVDTKIRKKEAALWRLVYSGRGKEVNRGSLSGLGRARGAQTTYQWRAGT